MGGFQNRNRSSGRGSQSQERGYKQSANKYAKTKKKLEDYYFSVGSNKQASDFNSTYEFILNHIKKTFMRGNDILEALRKQEEPDTDDWKPTLEMSTSLNTNTKERENLSI